MIQTHGLPRALSTPRLHDIVLIKAMTLTQAAPLVSVIIYSADLVMWLETKIIAHPRQFNV